MEQTALTQSVSADSVMAIMLMEDSVDMLQNVSRERKCLQVVSNCCFCFCFVITTLISLAPRKSFDILALYKSDYYYYYYYITLSLFNSVVRNHPAALSVHIQSYDSFRTYAGCMASILYHLLFKMNDRFLPKQVDLHCPLYRVATSSCRRHVDELATEPFLCCCTASMEQAADGAETAAIDGIISS